MSVFNASTFLNSEQGNAAGLIAILNSLAAAPAEIGFTSSLISMAASSYATARTLTVNGVLADELCIFITQATVSCGTALDAAAMRHRVQGTDLNNFAVMQDINQGSANGQQETLICVSFNQDLTPGNIDFDLRWARVAGSGTIYSLHQYLRVLRVKRR